MAWWKTTWFMAVACAVVGCLALIIPDLVVFACGMLAAGILCFIVLISYLNAGLREHRGRKV